MGIFMMFRCPETGHEGSTGVVREDQGAQPSQGKVEVRCLECGHVHLWDTAKARMDTPAAKDWTDLPVPARIA